MTQPQAQGLSHLGPQFGDYAYTPAVSGPVRDLTSSRISRGSSQKTMVEDYRAARDSWSANRERSEDRGGGMRMEDAEYRDQRPAPTVKQFMKR